MVKHAKPRRRRLLPVILALGLAIGCAAGGAQAVTAVFNHPSASPPRPPVVGDAESAADPVVAQSIAAAYQHRVHLTGLDDETSTTYLNPDGSFSKDVAAQPIRVRRAAGLIPVDTTLQQRADGTVGPRAATADVTLGGAGSTALASLPLGEGTLRYSWPKRLPAPRLSGSTALYPDVRPGVDLKIEVSVLGFETFFIVKDRPATPLADLELPLALTNLDETTAADGAVTLTDAGGKAVGHSSAPQAWDNTLDVSGSPRSRSVAGRFARSGDWSKRPVSQVAPGGTRTGAPVHTGTQRISVPAALLADPATRYPVTIDPAPSLSRYAFAYIDSAFPSTSYVNSSWDASQLHVGKNPDNGGINRALYQFASAAFANVHVLSARLATTETWAWNCTPQRVDLRSTKQWLGGMTWSTQPIRSNTVWANVTVAHGYNSSCPAAANNVGFDVTAMMAAYAVSGDTIFGVELTAHDETAVGAWKKFNSAATLSVTYNSLPRTPTQPQFASPAVKCGASPGTGPVLNTNANNVELEVWGTDADAGNVEADFWVTDATNGASRLPSTAAPAGYLRSVGPGGWRKVSLPKTGSLSVLQDGSYAWRARGADGRDVSPSYSAQCYFRVKNTPPLAPAITDSAGHRLYTPTAVDVAHNPMSVVFAAGGSADQVSAYSYSFNQSIPVLAQPPACGSTVGAVRTICPATPNGAVAASISFPEGISQLTVVSYDLATNRSAPTTVTFTWFRDSDPSKTGHGWLTDWTAAGADPPTHPAQAPAVALDSTAVQDAAGKRLSADLTLAGTAWVPASPLGDSSLANRTVWGLRFNGAATAVTHDVAGPSDNFLIDTTGSFTVGAWVNPAAAGAFTAVSQDISSPAKFSGFTLGADAAGHWRFCVPTGPGALSAANCVTDNRTSAAVGVWSFVLGYWDNDLKTLNILVSTAAGDFAEAAVLAHAPFTPHPAGQIVLGRDQSTGAAANAFRGDLAGVAVFQGTRDLNGQPIPNSGIPANDLRIAQLLDLAAPSTIPHPPS